MSRPASGAPRLILGSGAVLLCAVAWYLTVAPVALGGPLSLVLIRGTSMEPTYRTGDLVIGYHSPVVEPGDVVIFRGPAGTPVIHRLRAVEGDRLMTRGDNLPADDPWDTRTSDVLGTARLRLAGAGAAIQEFSRPPVLGALAAVLVASLVLWRGQKDGEEADEATDGAAAGASGRSLLAAAVMLAACGVGAVTVGAAASLTVTTDELASMVMTGPFDTYVDAPGGGGTAGGNGGGTGGGNGGKP